MLRVPFVARPVMGVLTNQMPESASRLTRKEAAPDATMAPGRA